MLCPRGAVPAGRLRGSVRGCSGRRSHSETRPSPVLQAARGRAASGRGTPGTWPLLPGEPGDKQPPPGPATSLLRRGLREGSVKADKGRAAAAPRARCSCRPRRLGETKGPRGTAGPRPPPPLPSPPRPPPHLAPADDVGVLRQQVHHLALALVAPLRAQHHRHLVAEGPGGAPPVGHGGRRGSLLRHGPRCPLRLRLRSWSRPRSRLRLPRGSGHMRQRQRAAAPLPPPPPGRAAVPLPHPGAAGPRPAAPRPPPPEEARPAPLPRGTARPPPPLRAAFVRPCRPPRSPSPPAASPAPRSADYITQRAPRQAPRRAPRGAARGACWGL